MSINDDDNNKAFDARTMIAIVLMVVVITVGMAVQNYFFPRQPLPVEPVATTCVPAETAQAAPTSVPAQVASVPSGAALATLEDPAAPDREMTHS
ncbi:MAG TPA: hypothetical protein PLI66_07995, partial [Spirochaetales bacterium]|nr:hypothetical protein [Spirochaetales bacterium]